MSQTQSNHLTHAPMSLKGDNEVFELNTSFESKQKRQVLKEKTQNINQKPKLNVCYDEDKMISKLAQDSQMYSEHNKQLQQYYSQEAMKECSFTPQLQTAQEQEKRSLYQFLSDQQDHVNRVEYKLEQIKLQDKEREDAHSYHPQTNEYSLPNRDQNVPVYERLYNLKNKVKSSAAQEDIVPPNSYQPQISVVSKNMIREDNVQDILYKDAQRRNQKLQMNENKKKTKVVAVNMKFTSNNSEKIVAQKFIREFEAIVDWIFDQTGQQRPSNVSYSIDYLKLGEILQKLNFVSIPQQCKNEKAIEFENLRLADERALLCEVWGTLRGDELGGVSKRNLCLFLLTLIGITEFKIKELPTNEEPHQQSLPQQTKIKNAHQPHDKQKLGKLDKDGNLIFNFEETRKVQKQFDILYRNRLGSEQLKKTTWTDTNTYKPEVLPQSQQLANKYREKLLEETAALIDGEFLKVTIPLNGQITHADLLVLQKKTQDYQQGVKKQQLQEQQLQQCTFHPQLITKSNNNYNKGEDKERGIQKGLQLFQLGKSIGSKRDRTKEEIDFERQSDECTFAPDLISSKSQNQSKLSDANDRSTIARDVDKTVSRMRDARKKRDQVQSMLDRGYNNQNSKSQAQLKTLKSTSDVQLPTYPSQQNQDAPIEMQTPEQEKVPLLFVDVNLGPGKTERIIVFEGDHSSDLANKFAQDHSLDDFMKDKLKELLDYQISGLLTKIDEEMASVCSDNENENDNDN